ncbi:MAG TPA: YHS domain-containing protein [Candidatus Angelobacter sp.]|nr:YHS domain-containing protein [Candidatus Angelobacter sp.]
MPHRVEILHTEKAEKAKLIIDQAGEKWENLEPLWLGLVTRIKAQVNQYKAQARLDYIAKHGIPHAGESRIADGIMVRDPVCGMMVDEKKAKFTTSREGKTIYFCSAACKASFDMKAQRYVPG